MKLQLKSAVLVAKKRVIPVFVALCLFVLPSIVFGQNPGDNPDAEPQAVPLDPKMTVILIGMGVMLAMRIIKKRVASLKPQAVTVK
ncbi:hypothetical protein ACQ33O_02185 [Ferruginibacter sp. SUN002]|uniref:hypothetical protein n=1 Tax=Ferruginibacter sp. SUN002 TaxID=2937789 RepID=UPI003D36A373